MTHKLGHGALLLAVIAVLAAGGCGKDYGSSSGKAKSTPAGKKSKPNGY